jgi:hypothetical protein
VHAHHLAATRSTSVQAAGMWSTGQVAQRSNLHVLGSLQCLCKLFSTSSSSLASVPATDESMGTGTIRANVLADIYLQTATIFQIRAAML